jgi:Flp pilus assembly protein TadG
MCLERRITLMLNRVPDRGRDRRRAAAIVELALLLPFLALLFGAALDYGRVFYYYVAVTNCARSGALYASIDAAHAADTTGIQSAAQAEAPELSSTLSVSSATSTDSAGNSVVSVTVSYPFKTISNVPGIPGSTTVGRTVQMRVLPP